MRTPKTIRITRTAFTMLELVITMLVSIILVGSVCAVIGDSLGSWNTVRNRICSSVYEDSMVACRFFEALVRKSNSEEITVNVMNNEITVFYNENDTDCYVRLFVEDIEVSEDESEAAEGRLYAEYGTVDSEGEPVEGETKTICSNVSNCVFTAAGTSAQMQLTLDNGTQQYCVLTSAVAHN